jgi:CheY-like chemotaxis protein/HPt (histidine-containing phosphotransfer) domain-containing protein
MQLRRAVASAVGRNAPSSNRKTSPRATPISGLRVLVAEDNKVNQVVATSLLKRLGYQADVVGNGMEALAAVHNGSYDVILMDMQMPVMDGLEATGRIRTEVPKDRQPSIIAMTANVMIEDRALCLGAGMDDFLAKPFRAEQLRAALDRLPVDRVSTRQCITEQFSPEAAVHADPVSTTGFSTAGRGDEQALIAAVRLRVRELCGPDPEQNRALVLPIVDQFMGDVAAELADLARAVKLNDQRQLGRLAHKLKGSAVTLGAEPLANLCRQLEAQASHDDVSAAWDLLQPLREELDRTCHALQLVSEEI